MIPLIATRSTSNNSFLLGFIDYVAQIIDFLLVESIVICYLIVFMFVFAEYGDRSYVFANKFGGFRWE